MRIKSTLLSMLAGLAVVGCSSGDDGDLNGGASGNGSTSYLAVNLASADVTRAQQGYEDGVGAENKVTNVRFYFFNGVGGAANVKLTTTGSYVNYYDWTPASGDQSDDTNTGDDVESNLAATIVINTQSGDKVPQMMAAVINPTGLDNTSKSLSQLRDLNADYAVSGLTQEGKFVMFNSVYAANRAEVCAVPITSDNLQKTAALAKENPVTIYVERNVAKVKTTIGVDFADNGKLLLKDKEDQEILVDGQQVYLQIDGWSLTADTDKGRLVKKINPVWEGTWWNGTHRSFWAINDMSAVNRYHEYVGSPLTKSLYTNENAQLVDDVNGTEGQAKTHTKVMLKGTLCKADGTPFTIVRHLGSYFADTPSDTETANFLNLKKSILSQLRASGRHYYYATTVEGKPARVELGEEDLVILPVGQVTTEDSKNNCYVYAQLTEAAKAKTWYTSMNEDATALENTSQMDAALANKDIVDRALAWKSGMTYYYYEIKHLKNNSNQDVIGVVRNHIYDTTVTKIAGLGTPVYNPGLVIYPEKPEPNNHFIAAEIKILSWRLVPNDYELDW